jgi:ribonuclease BN (tRNA processing enzyme)
MTDSEGLRVRVLGCGDAFGSGGRFQTAFLLEIGDGRILMDCGATTLVALNRAGIDPAVVDAVLISHLHGDHVGGLPFLILDQHFRCRRKRPLTVLGPPGTGERLRGLMRVCFPGSEAMHLHFPLEIEELRPGAAPCRPGPVEVVAAEVDHPSGAPSLGLRVQAGDRVLAYSGDTQWTDALITISDGADLFICECYAYEPGIRNHMNYRTLIDKRPHLRAKRIVLTHLSADMLARRATLEPEVLDDGQVIQL